MRINKYISETGFCSRREVDDLIKTRKVTINGKVAELGSIVEEGDDVRINGRPIGEKKATPVYIALYKPSGVTSTTDKSDPTNIVDYVDHKERIFPIGRLDKDSEGLILLTNDGDIVNEILRADGHHEKEYVVTVSRSITSSFIRGMANGVRILGTVTRKCKVERMSEYQFRIILTEGMNRQIRRMCEVFGYDVKRLKRVRVMNIELAGLKPGQYHDLTKEELQELFEELSYQKSYDIPTVPQKKQAVISPYAKSAQKEEIYNNRSAPKGPKGPKGPNRSRSKGPSTGQQPSPSRSSTGNNPNASGGYRTDGNKPGSTGGYRTDGNKQGSTGGYRTDGNKPGSSGGYRTDGNKPSSSGGYRTDGNKPGGTGGYRTDGNKPGSTGGYRTGGNKPSGGAGGYRTGGNKPGGTGGNRSGSNKGTGAGKPRGR